MSGQFPFADRLDHEAQSLLTLQAILHELREIKRLQVRRELDRIPRSTPSLQRQVDEIKRICAEHYGTTVEAIDSHERPDHVVLARYMAASFVSELLHVSDRELDRLFNRRSHFGANFRFSFKGRLETDARVREDRAKLGKELDRLWFGKSEPGPTSTTEARSPQRNGVAV